MKNRLPYADLKCPRCGYPLQGLSEPTCPECGNKFNPNWLYDVEYEHGARWDKLWLGLGAIAALGLGAFTFWLFMSFGGAAVCMLVAVIGLAIIVIVRRTLT